MPAAEDWKMRTRMLFSDSGVERLEASRVAVVGLGGVGAYAAEMIARAGVGSMLLLDSDCVGLTNKNRQLLALDSTIGRPKCDVMAERLRDINPSLQLTLVQEYLCEDNAASLLGGWRPDFLVDAIDTLSPKIALIQYCMREGIPMVSSMGAGAKVDATAVRLSDISRTRMCPLAHQLRKRLHRLGIEKGFLAVYSEEKPRREAVVLEESANKKSQVGTASYLPAVFGCVCAQAALDFLLRRTDCRESASGTAGI